MAVEDRRRVGERARKKWLGVEFLQYTHPHYCVVERHFRLAEAPPKGSGNATAWKDSRNSFRLGSNALSLGPLLAGAVNLVGGSAWLLQKRSSAKKREIGTAGAHIRQRLLPITQQADCRNKPRPGDPARVRGGQGL